MYMFLNDALIVPSDYGKLLTSNVVLRVVVREGDTVLGTTQLFPDGTFVLAPIVQLGVLTQEVDLFIDVQISAKEKSFMLVFTYK